MQNKMTYAMALEIAISAVAENAEVAEKLEALKASLAKKSSAERKPTATQMENEKCREAILAHMASGEKYTITDVMKMVPELAEFSNQRVSALMRQLKEANLVERLEIKRKAYFMRVEG